MSRERLDHPLADDLGDPEDELRRALAIEPSPEFMPRVRARIAGERASAAWLGWRAALAGVALGALAIGLAWRGDLSPHPAGSEVQHIVSGRGVALAAEPAQEIRPVRAASVDRPVARVERRVRLEPEVLIPPDAALALARVLELARAGALEDATPPDAAAVADPLEVVPIVVPSIPIANVEIQTGVTPGAGGT